MAPHRPRRFFLYGLCIAARRSRSGAAPVPGPDRRGASWRPGADELGQTPLGATDPGPSGFRRSRTGLISTRRPGAPPTPPPPPTYYTWACGRAGRSPRGSAPHFTRVLQSSAPRAAWLQLANLATRRTGWATSSGARDHPTIRGRRGVSVIEPKLAPARTRNAARPAPYRGAPDDDADIPRGTLPPVPISRRTRHTGPRGRSHPADSVSGQLRASNGVFPGMIRIRRRTAKNAFMKPLEGYRFTCRSATSRSISTPSGGTRSPNAPAPAGPPFERSDLPAHGRHVHVTYAGYGGQLRAGCCCRASARDRCPAWCSHRYGGGRVPAQMADVGAAGSPTWSRTRAGRAALVEGAPRRHPRRRREPVRARLHDPGVLDPNLLLRRFLRRGAGRRGGAPARRRRRGPGGRCGGSQGGDQPPVAGWCPISGVMPDVPFCATTSARWMFPTSSRTTSWSVLPAPRTGSRRLSHASYSMA